MKDSRKSIIKDKGKQARKFTLNTLCYIAVVVVS